MSDLAQKSDSTAKIDVTTANSPDTPHGDPFICARKLSDLRDIPYPEGITRIQFDLDKDTENGLLRYDRAFLLQFMSVCKGRPSTLAPLEYIGLDPSSRERALPHAQSRRHVQSDSAAPFGPESIEHSLFRGKVTTSHVGSSKFLGRHTPAEAYYDGWATTSASIASRAPAKVGLSHVAKISKGPPITFGPSSVFAGKNGAANKHENLSRTGSGSNSLQIPGSHAIETPNVKLGERAHRRRLVLQPRSKPVESEAGYDAVKEKEAAPEMSEADAKTKIAENVKEFFAVRSLSEAEVYFTNIPAVHHHRLVDTLVSRAVESKEADAQLVANFFEQTVTKGRCSAKSFEAGLLPIAELIDDIAIDAPKAFQLFAMMIKGAGLDETRRTNLASKSIDSSELLALLNTSPPEDPSTRPAQDNVNVTVFLDMVVDLQNVRGGALLFETVPLAHHPTFIAQVMDATLSMKNTHSELVAEAFREAIFQESCGLGDFQEGVARIAKTISNTSVTDRFMKLAAIVRGVGLDARSREEIAEFFGPLAGRFHEATRPQSRRSDEDIVKEFMEQSMRRKMCSTALFPASQQQGAVETLVQDIALHAPDALKAFSLMIRGSGLDD